MPFERVRAKKQCKFLNSCIKMRSQDSASIIRLATVRHILISLSSSGIFLNILAKWYCRRNLDDKV